MHPYHDEPLSELIASSRALRARSQALRRRIMAVKTRAEEVVARAQRMHDCGARKRAPFWDNLSANGSDTSTLRVKHKVA
jgi:hypothetical protein